MQGFRLALFSFALAFCGLALAGHALSATIEMAALIRFEKVLGISNELDVSYGSIDFDGQGQVSISPQGNISLESSGSVRASADSHPGLVVIDDGRDQQFGLIADAYKADGKVRPVTALCSLEGAAGAPCDGTRAYSKGAKATNLSIGMVVQVLGEAADASITTGPSFDLAVVYF